MCIVSHSDAIGPLKDIVQMAGIHIWLILVIWDITEFYNYVSLLMVHESSIQTVLSFCND